MMEQPVGPTSPDIYRSGEYLRNNPDWHVEDSAWKAGHVLQLIRRNAVHARSIVEVGAGAGEVLRLISEQLPDAAMTGFDISPDALRLASPRSSGNLRFELGSPFGTSGYDLALALDVFEHVEDYPGFLREMTQLAPMQIYNIPLDLSVRSLIQPSLIMQQRDSVGHLHYFLSETALAALEDTGHKIVDCIYHSRSLARKDLKGAFRRWFFAWKPDLCVRLMGGFAMTVLCRSKS